VDALSSDWLLGSRYDAFCVARLLVRGDWRVRRVLLLDELTVSVDVLFIDLLVAGDGLFNGWLLIVRVLFDEFDISKL
jgi:hypothetical protein